MYDDGIDANEQDEAFDGWAEYEATAGEFEDFWLVDFTGVLDHPDVLTASDLDPVEVDLDPEIEARMRARFALIGETLEQMLLDDEPDRELTRRSNGGDRRRRSRQGAPGAPPPRATACRSTAGGQPETDAPAEDLAG